MVYVLRCVCVSLQYATHPGGNWTVVSQVRLGGGGEGREGWKDGERGEGWRNFDCVCVCVCVCIIGSQWYR